jgi:hypothetical protein
MTGSPRRRACSPTFVSPPASVAVATISLSQRPTGTTHAVQHRCTPRLTLRASAIPKPEPRAAESRTFTEKCGRVGSDPEPEHRGEATVSTAVAPTPVCVVSYTKSSPGFEGKGMRGLRFEVGREGT